MFCRQTNTQRLWHLATVNPKFKSVLDGGERWELPGKSIAWCNLWKRFKWRPSADITSCRRRLTHTWRSLDVRSFLETGDGLHQKLLSGGQLLQVYVWRNNDQCIIAAKKDSTFKSNLYLNIFRIWTKIANERFRIIIYNVFKSVDTMYLTSVILSFLLHHVICHLPTREDDQKQVTIEILPSHLIIIISMPGVSGPVQVHWAHRGHEDAQVWPVLAGGHDQAAAHLWWSYRGLSREVNTL